MTRFWLFWVGLVPLTFCSNLAWSQSTKDWECRPQKKESAREFDISHRNDADVVGGNDQGFTFSNAMRFQSLEASEDSAQEWDTQLQNRFYTGFRKDANGQPLGSWDQDEIGRRNINFLEDWRLECRVKNWDLGNQAEEKGAEASYLKWMAGINYESSSQSWSGTRAQYQVHKRVGVEPVSYSSDPRTYNYDHNQINRHRLGLELGFAQGIRKDITQCLDCRAEAGLTLRSDQPQDSTADLELEFRLHSLENDWIGKTLPSAALYGRWNCHEYLDLQDRDSSLEFGAEFRLGDRAHSRFTCEVSWTEIFEQKDSAHEGMNDRDRLLQVSFGVNW